MTRSMIEINYNGPVVLFIISAFDRFSNGPAQPGTQLLKDLLYYTSKGFNKRTYGFSAG
ncbi:MAG TPA: hypothetical protein VF813_01255 [Anaerolineaceae bacterium]